MRSWMAGLLVAASVLVAVPARAAEPDPALPPLPDWERAAYKTLTFETMAVLGDAALFAVISGTGAGTGAAFLVANVASAVALYYPYESVWNAVGPSPSETSPATLATKTLGYEVLTGARHVALSYAFTGALLPSVRFAAAALVMDTVLYVTNEVAWDYFRPRAEPSAAQ